MQNKDFDFPYEIHQILDDLTGIFREMTLTVRFTQDPAGSPEQTEQTYCDLRLSRYTRAVIGKKREGVRGRYIYHQDNWEIPLQPPKELIEKQISLWESVVLQDMHYIPISQAIYDWYRSKYPEAKIQMSRKWLDKPKGRNPMQSVYLIIPLTRRAKKWVDDNIQLESWQWQPVGGRLQGFAVEARYVENILNGMTADGLVYGTDFKTEPPLVQPHQESQGSPYMLFIFHQVLAQEQFERYADQKNILMKKHSVHRISISQSKGQEILYFMQAQGFKYYYDFETLPPLNPKITFEILDPADQGTNPRRRNPNDINQLGNLYDMSQFLVEAGEGDTWFKVVHVSDQLVSYVDYPSVLPSGKELSWSRDGAEYWKHKTRRVRQAIQLTVTGNNVSCEHYFKDRGFDANAVLPTVCYIVMSQNFSGQNNPRRHNPFGDDTPEMKKHMTEILTADRKMMRRRKRHLTTEEISDWAMRTWGDQAEKIMDEINEYRKTPGGRKLWKFLFIEIYGIFKK